MSDGIGANTPVTRWPLQQAPGDRCVDLFIDASALSFFLPLLSPFCLSLSLFRLCPSNAKALFCVFFCYQVETFVRSLTLILPPETETEPCSFAQEMLLTPMNYYFFFFIELLA